MRALLARVGVRGQAAREALRVLIIYTIGFAAFATHPPGAAEDAKLTVADLQDNFASGLRWLLAGIARSRPGSGETGKVG